MEKTIERLSGCCDELLIHAVDSEGLARGIEEKVAQIMSVCGIPVTYAGGISSFEDLDKLFDRFYRGDSARSGSGKAGYGLGLSIARAIAEKNRARLTVEETDRGNLLFRAAFKRE